MLLIAYIPALAHLY